MSEFLKKLKDAVENEDFNSEAARRINEINELAETKFRKSSEGNSYVDTPHLDELKKKTEETPVEPVPEDKMGELNSEYEKQMAETKKIDTINSQFANLMQMDEMVRLSIGDLMGHIEVVETKFITQFDENDVDKLKELKAKISEIKEFYGKLSN